MLRLLLAAALLLSVGSPARRRTVSSIDYLGNYSASSRVSLWRGVTADLVIHGSLIDLTTGVEVQNSSGTTASGVSATVTDHLGGSDTRLFVRITSSSGAALGNYKLLIHYLVEATGPDHVDLRLFNRGSVSSFSIVEPKTSGFYIAGQPYTLVASGSNLSGAALRSTSTTRGTALTVESTISTSSTEARYRVRFNQSAGYSFVAGNLFDGAMPSPPSFAQESASGYTGNGTLGLNAALVDSIAGMGPLVVNPSGAVTLSGPNLAPTGYTAQLMYNSKSGGLQAAQVTFSSICTKATLDKSAAGIPASCTPTATFSAPRDARPDSMALQFQAAGNDSPILTRQFLPLPLPLYVKVAPDSLQTDTSLSSGLAVMRGGSSTRVIGVNLFSTAEVFAPGTAGVTRTPVAATFSDQPLTVQSVQRRNLSGDHRDQLTLTPPALTATQAGTLTITTAGGTKSLSALFVPPPVATSLTAQGPNGSVETLPSGTTLRTGTTYTIHGSNLVVINAGTVFPSIIAPGNPFGTSCCTSQTTTSLDFRPTTTSPAAPLTLRTFGGSTTVGTYKISAPFVMPSVASISAAPNPVVGGTSTTATIAFAGAIAGGADTGFVDITSNASDAVPAVLRVPALTNPLVVTVPTRIVGSSRQVNLTASAAAGAATGTSASTALTIQPIQVSQLALAKSVISGGHTVQATVTLNANPGPTNGASISVLSSNPAVATVPATVAMTGQTASFNVVTSVVGHASPVTITVSLGGATQTATLTLTPPVVQTLAFNRPSIVSLDTATLTITLDAVPVAPDTIQFAVSDTSVFGNLSIRVMTTQTISIPITGRLASTPHTATITASSSTSNPSASIALAPLALTMVLTPSTTNAGVGVSATVTLNAPVNAPPGQEFAATVTSSDTLVVSNSPFQTGSLKFANRQTVVVFSVPTRAPQSQAKSTVITYKMQLLNAGAAANALMPTVSKTLTVNP